jgi:hypothetical protein
MMYVKTMVGSSLPQFISEGCLFVILLFVFIYAYWCPTRFRYHMIFVSFKSNMTGTTSGEGIAYSSGVPPQPSEINWGKDEPTIVFTYIILKVVTVNQSAILYNLHSG